MLAVRIQRPLKRKLEKIAKQKGMNLTEFVEYTLWRETKDIELSAADYEEIAKQIEDAGGRSRTNNMDAKARNKPEEGS